MPISPIAASLVLDTHLHLYRVYEVAATLQHARRNLLQLAQGLGLARPIPAACLTERADHNVFDELKKGRRSLEPAFDIRVPAESAALLLHTPEDADPMILLAGRQMVTAENIEVLGLVMEDLVPDGLPLEDTIARVRERGGIPVLSWAPGKWFFGRGRRVRETVARARPGELLLGDTSLRPWGWREPRIMRAARRRGLGVVAGSDPLPFAEDAVYAGRMATVFGPAPFDIQRPASEIIRRLVGIAPLHRRAGLRLSPFSVFVRIMRNRACKTKPPARVPA